jgi:hypothetical protein
MGKRRHTPEQIINKLREAEVELGRGIGLPPKTSPPSMLLVQVASGVAEPCFLPTAEH